MLSKAGGSAGVLEDGMFAPTETGTPQGGTISPLLANIALHGMEEVVQSKRNRKRQEQPILVRYADDLVLLHSDLEKLKQAEQKLVDWLAEMGLHMNPKKTRITHTLTPYEGNVGFDFLGFVVRQFPVGNDLAPDLWKRESLGYTLSEGGKDHAKGAKNVHTGVQACSGPPGPDQWEADYACGP